jgi:hypothetical protein
MKRIGETEFQRGAVEHIGLLGDRHILDMPGRHCQVEAF